MKKKIIIFIAILCTIALLVILSIFIDNASKSSKTTIDKEKKENTSENQSKNKLSKGFQERHTYYKTIKCPVLNDENIIGYIGGSASGNIQYIVTKNTVYVLNKSKLFSNDTNCKSIITENFDSEIFDASCDWGGCSIETQNNYYTYSATDDKITKMEEEMEIYYKDFGQFSKLGNNVIKNIGTFVNLEDYVLILSADNKIKLYKPTFDNNGNEIGEYKDINYDFKGETVKAIINNYIKTDKAYYKISKYATNKDECKKYADVKCQYEYKIEKAKYLTENYDKIAIVSSNEIIDKEGNIYDN